MPAAKVIMLIEPHIRSQRTALSKHSCAAIFSQSRRYKYCIEPNNSGTATKCWRIPSPKTIRVSTSLRLTEERSSPKTHPRQYSNNVATEITQKIPIKNNVIFLSCIQSRSRQPATKTQRLSDVSDNFSNHEFHFLYVDFPPASTQRLKTCQLIGKLSQ